MEVKINKEIREYSENMFFGLTLRQFFFSVMGCIAAVGIYFLCRDAIGLELTTWLCVLGVVPFAAIGFITYNGMPAEKVVIAYMKSKLIYPKRYLSRPVPFYYSMMENAIGLKQGSLSRKQKRKMNREKKGKRGKRK
ncbi:MAG: PrgI family protein [Anaerobutyricum hallii]|uniref:PrgI family protein n=1 Tax=Anaerobutyricum hallii TaxID=39488 RepID=UPI002A80664D|nr:PrgI family protein [Anaerobutyricum hallii]MDY4579078.1 PrgI family protein [Anaerobutyricum hallii]